MGELFLKKVANKLVKLNTEPKYNSGWLKMSVGAEYSLAKRCGSVDDVNSLCALKRVIKRMK